MRTTIVVIVLLSLVAPGAALAQHASTRVSGSGAAAAQTPAPQLPPPPPPPGRDLGRWWKNSEVVAELQLSQAQISQIESTFLDHRLKLIDLRAELERQETRLQPLVEADQPDEAKVAAQIDLVVAARGKLEKANTLMMLAIRRVLSVDQWKKLQGMQQHRTHRYSGGGAAHARPAGHVAPPAHPAPPRPPDEPDPLNDLELVRAPLPASLP